MKEKFVALIAPLLLSGAAVASAAPPDANPPDLIDVQAATCAQFANAMFYAKPPANPTEQQAAFAVLAQDDLVLAMMWVNGHLAGRDGAKGAHAFQRRSVKAIRTPFPFALVALAAGAVITQSGSAWDYDNRREERREAIVAGVVRHERLR
jgi:hypothetical protein